MKTKYENGYLNVEVENESEKVFAFVATKHSDSSTSFVTLFTESELFAQDWFDLSEWSADPKTLEIGESCTHGYWFYNKSEVLTRMF